MDRGGQFGSQCGRWALLGAALLAGCGAEESKDTAPATPDADTAVVVDLAPQDVAPPPPDAGPVVDASLADQLGDFCRAMTRAKCEWAMSCASVSEAVRARVLELPGATVGACAAAASMGCVEDTADRAARGTVTFDPVQVEDCVEGANRAPCPDGPVSQWIGDWHEFINQRCASVAAGNVAPDGACERNSDCAHPGNLCIGDVCRPPESADLLQDCTPTANSPGEPNEDATCPAGLCVKVPANDQDKTGLCSLDCTSEHCPAGSTCLQISVGAMPYFYCVALCQRDNQCRNDTVCVPISDPDGAKMCWVKRE